jgi:hypothetical protein
MPQKKKVTKKRSPKKPRPVTIKDVAAAAHAEGIELNITLIPDLDSVNLGLSERWKDELRQAAKLTGEPEEKILQRFAASFMRWKPTYLHIAEFAAKARQREEMEVVEAENKKLAEAQKTETLARQTAAVKAVQDRADAVLSEVQRRTAELPKAKPTIISHLFRDATIELDLERGFAHLIHPASYGRS